jgi:AhpC/TSA family protein
MSLEEKLAAIREMAKARMPPEIRAVMHKSTEDLRAAGIMSRLAKVGAAAPDFTLANVAGQPVSLASLRARGPVVLSFYRGRW